MNWTHSIASAGLRATLLMDGGMAAGEAARQAAEEGVGIEWLPEAVPAITSGLPGEGATAAEMSAAALSAHATDMAMDRKLNPEFYRHLTAGRRAELDEHVTPALEPAT